MRKSKAKFVVDLTGPSESVMAWIHKLVDVLRVGAAGDGVQAIYPVPIEVTPVLRNRKPKAPKPERKARKANSSSNL